jgi:hypothetical protein
VRWTVLVAAALQLDVEDVDSMLTLLTHKLYMCYLLLLASGTIFDFFFMRDTFQSHNYQPF